MKQVQIVGADKIAVVEVEKPTFGSNDILVKMKAVGICGSDTFYTHVGGIPPLQGHTPLGHEPAGEVEGVGENIKDVQVGNHIVINSMAFEDGILGSGGLQGGFANYVIITNAKANKQFRVIPNEIPWKVAALNEPMAVAHHAVNRSGAKAGDKAVVFGAGPIGLGALLSLKSKGVGHIVVVDILTDRLEKALSIGADAVINSAKEDVFERLKDLQGVGYQAIPRDERAGTDVYIDAAGVPVVTETILKMVKHKAVLTVVAVHKKPVSIDFGDLLTSEVDIRLSMGYPNEIFEVTDSIIANWEKYSQIISDELPFDKVLTALKLAATPGAAEKVVVTFE
ncbi:zinc-dependent alcohol dehydrogenase [Liquorilactobacillus mali]|uniref:zinc-dependent alcohol dehydrogenase n=1 Tax=Liquorilactobacillus mali TaxID=1618 RepID=UPI00235048AA|nr:zinc-binding dehydrogenase [Liquorilactobacillus mali]MDC7952817.1 zinc-binding dehydrogenase [Liquorilactobacillus mali]